MPEIAKFASIPIRALFPVGFLASLWLLHEKAITFNEAIILILISLLGSLVAYFVMGNTSGETSLIRQDAHSSQSPQPRQQELFTGDISSYAGKKNFCDPNLLNYEEMLTRQALK